MMRLLFFACAFLTLMTLGCGESDDSTKPTADTERPVVHILQPSDTLSVTAGLVIVRARATDNDGVTRVAFFDGDTIIGEDRVGIADVFDVRWTVDVGPHTLRAVAFDETGNSGEHAIELECEGPDTEAPVVVILQPERGLETEEGPLTIEASATDDCAVTRVEFFVGSNKIAEDTDPEGDRYACTWTAETGVYTIRVLAWDAAGNAGADTSWVYVGQVWRWRQNSPNPFCPDSTVTAIEFTLQEACEVEIEVHTWDDGMVVKTLVSGSLPPGNHVVMWDGRNSASQPVAAGDYRCGMKVHVGGRYLIFPSFTITVACP